MKVDIQGYGKVKVRVPKKRTKENVELAIVNAITDTMQLLDPRSQAERWHPALGKGGYTNAYARREADGDEADTSQAPFPSDWDDGRG